MGVIEGYSADLYCDCDSCQSGEECRPKYADFAGDDKAAVNRQIKLAGWKVSKDRMNCYAPGHAPKGGKKCPLLPGNAFNGFLTFLAVMISKISAVMKFESWRVSRWHR